MNLLSLWRRLILCVMLAMLTSHTLLMDYLYSSDVDSHDVQQAFTLYKEIKLRTTCFVNALGDDITSRSQAAPSKV